MSTPTAILLGSCPDQWGIVARLASFSGVVPRLALSCGRQDVAEDLDAGPIIEQDARVSHRDTVEALVRKGRDVERLALAGAVRLHLHHRVLTHGNKTVVFE